MSRSTNSTKNIAALYGYQILVMILNFVTRTFFIRYLGEEYLGINGLFTNILSVLSLAELGVGTAILFKLYKPIEEKDQKRIQLLMKLYKKVYAVIGWAIALVGLVLIPFLRFIIEDYDTLAKLGINAVLIFLLYVFNSASSYWFFAYKQAIVKAHQKAYALTLWGYAVSALSSISQILVLVFTGNFILYTAVMIAFNILTNFVFARVSSKMYPYINEKIDEKIPKNEVIDLFKDCGALFIYKINTAVISASDNIVLSIVKGIKVVGLYSNYYVITSTIKLLLSKFFDSIEASLGSIHAIGKLEWKQNIFITINFATVLMYGCAGSAVAVIGDDFIRLWIGERFIVDTISLFGNTYYLPLSYLIALEIYFAGLQMFLARFRNSFGLFRQLKFRPILSMIINLAVTVVLVPYIGIAGAVIGTLAAALLSDLIFDPIVLNKHEIKSSLFKYYAKNTVYFIVAFGSAILSRLVCNYIGGSGWLMLILHGLVSVLIPGAVFLLLFCRAPEEKLLFGTVKNTLKGKK